MNGSAPASRAVAAAREAYAARKVAPTGEPTGEMEDLSDGFAPSSLVTMPMPPPQPSAVSVPAAARGAEQILELARVQIAALDEEIARLEDCRRQRGMLAAMLHAATTYDTPAFVPVPSPAPASAARAPMTVALDQPTDEEQREAAEIRAWQLGGPRPGWM